MDVRYGLPTKGSKQNSNDGNEISMTSKMSNWELEN